MLIVPSVLSPLEILGIDVQLLLKLVPAGWRSATPSSLLVFCSCHPWIIINLDLPSLDGVTLTEQEHDFYTLVSAELNHYLQQGNHKAVLLFPPVSSRFRYLIHRCTQSYDTLSSFSVGEGWQRRTVICHAGIRLPTQSEDSQGNTPDKNYNRFWSSSYNKKSESGRGRQNWRQRKDARPDKAMYVAKGKHCWKSRERQHSRIKDGESEVRECQRYTYHKGQLVQVTKTTVDMNGQGRVEIQENTEKKDEVLLDNAEAKERLVDCNEPVHGPSSQGLPKERSSSHVPENVDTLGKAVQDTGHKGQDVSDIGIEKYQETEKNSYAQEKVLDHIKTVLISGGLSKSLEGLEVSKKIQEEGEEETKVTEDFDDLKNKSESVEEKGTEYAEKLEKNTQNLGETIESPLEPAPRSQELDKNKSPAEGECRKNVEKTVQSQEGTYCKTESCEVRTESNKTENNRPNLDLFQDTGEAETPEVCELDITAGCAKVQEEAIMEDNKRVTKLERHCDDVEMETSGSVSNTMSVNIFPVPDVDSGNRKDEEVQDISTGKSTKPGISESHQTSDLSEEDQNLTKLLPTCSSSVQMGAEDLTGNDEDKQKMLEQIMTEIITHVSENDVHIQPLIGDFSEYTETQVDHGRFGHIIEIYGFSPTLTTDDLMEPFLEYREKDFRLLWVDQKHALGIFSSPEDAFAASCKTHPAMKFRPLSQASRQSKIRAHDKMASLQPYKDRPQTDASVAKRMVNRALGHRKPEADSSVKEPGTSPC